MYGTLFPILKATRTPGFEKNSTLNYFRKEACQSGKHRRKDNLFLTAASIRSRFIIFEATAQQKQRRWHSGFSSDHLEQQAPFSFQLQQTGSCRKGKIKAAVASSHFPLA